MRLGAAPLRALATGLLATLVCACSSLPFLPKGNAAGAVTPARDPEITLYELEIEAPAPLRMLLLECLDIARFQRAPRSEAIAGPELDRLPAPAPAPARPPI